MLKNYCVPQQQNYGISGNEVGARNDENIPDIHLVLSACVKKVSEHICVKDGGRFVHSSSHADYREGAYESLTLATQKSHAESVTQRRASVPSVTVTPQTTYRARVQNRGNGNECGGCSVM